MRHVNCCEEQVELDAEHSELNDRRGGLLDAQDFRNVLTSGDEGLEVIKEFLLLDEGGKYTDCINIRPGDVYTQPVGPED